MQAMNTRMGVRMDREAAPECIRTTKCSAPKCRAHKCRASSESKVELARAKGEGSSKFGPGKRRERAGGAKRKVGEPVHLP